jgi:hypothetical protein
MIELVLFTLALVLLLVIGFASIILNKLNTFENGQVRDLAAVQERQLRLERKLDALRIIVASLPDYDRAAGPSDMLDPLGSISGHDLFMHAIRDYDALGNPR